MGEQPHDAPARPDLEGIAAAKCTARARARIARDALDRRACKEASASAALNLLEMPESELIGMLLAYAALPAEIDPLPAVSAMRRRGVTIAYPRIEAAGLLSIHVVDHELDLKAGPFGLAQPSEHAPRADCSHIDAVIVPGVAFDEHGGRLGYGGGYYDRLLPTLPPTCLRIGFTFDEQLLADLPTENHDQRVDIVVTQTRVIRPPDARILSV